MSWHRHLLVAGVSAALAGAVPDALADGPLHEQIAEVTQQLTEHPDDTALLLRRGELHRLHNQWTEARTDFQRVQRLTPDDPEPLFRLGRLALDEGKPDEAVAWLTRFVAQQPDHVDGQLHLARSLARSHRPAAAVPHFTRAIALAKKPRPEWFAERCHAQTALPGDHTAEALAGLDEGSAQLGQLPALQLEAIELELRRHDFDAALRRLDTILAGSERKERWLQRQGEILELAGRGPAARTAYTAARAAFEALPLRLQRSFTLLHFQRELDDRLVALTAPPETGSSK